MSAVTLILLIVQRDLGTASIFTFIYAGMIYTATGKRRMLLISFILLLAAGHGIAHLVSMVSQLQTTRLRP